MLTASVVRLIILQLAGALFVGSIAVAADPKPSARIAVGDLVEYVSGMGPTVGEVVDGPDPSNFYVLRVPSAGDVPVNGNKLRLLQRAGAPRASFNAGDMVDVRTSSGMLRAKVVKVTGAWCQLEAPGTVGWAECKGLRVAQPTGNAQATETVPPPQSEASQSAAAQAPKPDSAPGPSLKGIYTNADGMGMIEFLAKGKAYFSFQGVSQECKHRQSGKKIILTCYDEDTVFTLDEDGSLTGPPDSFFSRLKKKS